MSSYHCDICGTVRHDTDVCSMTGREDCGMQRLYRGRHVLTYELLNDRRVEIVITREDRSQYGVYVRMGRWDALMTGLGLAWLVVTSVFRRGRWIYEEHRL